jgi:SAM-dependent methyltransferase
MDGYKKDKKNKWRGQLYSDTRFAVIKFLEKEAPVLQGRVLNVSSGGWPVPKQLLNKNQLTEYITFDMRQYGDAINSVDVVGDVHSMPFKDGEFDAIINNQAIECYKNPFKAISEMYRILCPGGVLLIDAPFNHAWFGYGGTPDSLKKKNKVYDYWRITPQGLEMLLEQFSKVIIETSGPNKWDPYCIMAKAIK